MKLDTRELEPGSLIEADVVIVGGGIVGIALARQLADGGLGVAILESGGEEPDEPTQTLYEGKATLEGPDTMVRNQDQYLRVSRYRYFGGSGNRWGGVCLPLDPVDFMQRDWVSYSGWPMTLEELQPYYDRACTLLDIAPFFGANAPAPPFEINDARRIRSRPLQLSRHTGVRRAGDYEPFKNAALEHPRIRVYLNANVTHIQLDEGGKSVSRLEVRCLDGARHSARGKTYVLATGGIENVRLLLGSRDVHRNGIGNHSDWLGRGFQGHAAVAHLASQFLPLLPKAWMDRHSQRTRRGFSFVLGTTAEAQREVQSGNFSVYLSGRTTLRQPEAEAIHGLAARLAGRPELAMNLLGAMFALEHTPNRESRITLIEDQLDPLGMPRIRLRWKHSSFDLESLDRSIRQIVRELGSHEAGRLRWNDLGSDTERFVQIAARHHMGATRMATGPGLGVVDEHCRVHGVGNFYIGGSSVFPTSGIANPTLTILALTARLGDHLLATSGDTA